MERTWKDELCSYNEAAMQILQSNVMNLKSCLFHEVAKDLSRTQKMERQLATLKRKRSEDSLSESAKTVALGSPDSRIVVKKEESCINVMLIYCGRTYNLVLDKCALDGPYDDDLDFVAKLLVAVCLDDNARRQIDLIKIRDVITLKFSEFESLLDMLSSTEKCGLSELNSLRGASDIKSFYCAVLVSGITCGWDLEDPFPFDKISVPQADELIEKQEEEDLETQKPNEPLETEEPAKPEVAEVPAAPEVPEVAAAPAAPAAPEVAELPEVPAE